MNQIPTQQALATPGQAGALAAVELTTQCPIHFIGVGGVGMSGLAKILAQMGFQVSGSDQQASAYTQQLEAVGVKVFIGHDASHVPANSAVVRSTAINPANPEIQEAQQKGYPLLHRSDVLQIILKYHTKTIGITGTHGKTSITGLTGQMLTDAELSPTIVAGGKLPGLKTNACYGASQTYAVAELDESDGTVVKYQPTYTILSNLELDHPDHYADGTQGLLNTFVEFLDQLGNSELILYNAACPLTQQLLPPYLGKLPLKSVGLDASQNGKADFWLEAIEAQFNGTYTGTLHSKTYSPLPLALKAPGIHMLWNASFVAALGLSLSIAPESIQRTVREFSGMGRRFEQLGTFNGALLIDDYAHHPTEIKVTLATAQQFLGSEKKQAGGRVIALVQPHRYARLATLWNDYLPAFSDADEVWVTDIFSAGEAPIDGVSSERLAGEIAQQHPNVIYTPQGDWQAILNQAQLSLTPNDLFITIGAGDVTGVGRQLATLGGAS